jgi:parvulin-like peptidyl-prolyl isomerase
MKRIIMATVLLGLLGLAVFAGACGGGTSVPTGAIAVVGDQTVTQQQFDEIWAQAKAQYAATKGAPAFPKEGTAEYNQLKASITNYLVQNALIAQEAAKMSVSVSAKDMAARIKQITQQVGGQTKLDKLLKQQGVTMDQLKTQLKAQMLQEAVKAKVDAKVTVSDAQAKKYYEDPANKSQFVVADQVTARHVLVKTKAEAEKVKALLEANNTDAGWKKIAAQYSIDPGSKGSGGNLGSCDKSRMVKPFADAAFALKANTISDPVKTQYGWHIIEVTGKTPGKNQTFEEAKATIQATLKYQLATTAWDKWLKDAESTLGIAYATGFNPAALTASPVPSSSGSPAPASSATP